ncbi:MAG: hypothetical protein JNM82_08045, partial [Rhodocyclaceae bacterium]|nr:hypothetical protein [Rhodocyclaceae bacterium]
GGHILVHGTREVRGEGGSFFAFFNVARSADNREPYFAELFLPYLHMAIHRMGLTGEPESGEIDLDAVLTERECQVLQWIHDGKKNMEVGQILGISHLTVKNHVRKILHKLKVSNRAQAVSKALSLRLIRNGN